ncbi:MAG: reverse transcriptase/maturase family protein [Campylobacterota bacterium]|nr:reverse transcriptase/maturase family protein [Campylobacterota bacterium]
MYRFEELYKAYLSCRKRKRNTINALKFEQNLIENLINLETSLNNYTYTPKRSVCFLTTSPKLREVFAADFSDRVVHHLIVPILEQIYEPKFIYDSYSSRSNKGIHHAIKRAKKFRQSTTFYMQLDIKNFFYSIDKNILFYKLKDEIIKSYHKVKNTTIKLEEMLWIVNKIIYHNITNTAIIRGSKKGFENIPPHKTLFKIPQEKGLPIGNLTSQFFANVYMNKFDHFVKRELKCKKYIRYVDDFVVFDKSKYKLNELKYKIASYLYTNLGLRLREDIKLKNNQDGLDFLGYIIRPHYILTRKRVVNNFKYKKAKYLDKYEKLKGDMGLEEIKKFLSVQASFKGHIKHSNSYNLCKKIGEIDDKKYIDMLHRC